MILEAIQRRNPNRKIYSVDSPEFAPYGKMHDHVTVTGMLQMLCEMPMPAQGTDLYIPCEERLMNHPEAKQFTEELYAQTPCEIGYYNGYNSKLNALEYHKCSEIVAQAYDVVLVLGKIEQIKDDTFYTEDTKLFYLPAGRVAEIYATSLHFSPCMATSAGIRQIVVLSKNTNTPLDHPVESKAGENRFLLEKDKWVLAHKEATNLLKAGAYEGLVGENVYVQPV